MNNTILTDFKRLAVLLIPVRLRRSVLVAFLAAVALPFSKIKRSLSAYADEKATELKITGQTCKLQKLLNDTFDLEERRIKIIDSSKVDLPPVYVFERGGDNALFVRDISQPVFIRSRLNTVDVPIDFYVVTPKELGLSDNPLLKALVNTYKLASKRWLLKEF